MIKRRISALAHKALSRQAAVALLGPRQVGKTTLAQEIGKSCASLYLDLESREDLAKLADPALFFQKNADSLIILD
ncbi:MAG TPA: AAA family ATPase, partial [Gammaproteobacteria bacterium]|nr:AAA family ATPase [Gammaproteobacteria bacterium]